MSAVQAEPGQPSARGTSIWKAPRGPPPPSCAPVLTLGHTWLCPGLRDHPCHLGPQSETRLPPRLNLGLRSKAGGGGSSPGATLSAAQSSGSGCCCSVTDHGLATGDAALVKGFALPHRRG